MNKELNTVGAMPVDIQVCRTCFAAGCKLYSMTSHKILCKAYEDLTGLLIENDSVLPPFSCSECARRLLDCAKFRTTSLRAHSILQNIVSNHGYVTQELIKSVKDNHNSSYKESDYDNKSGYDMEFELTEIENTYNVINNADGIKTSSPDVITRDILKSKNAINDNIVPNLHGGIANNGIKIENPDLIIPDIVNGDQQNILDTKDAILDDRDSIPNVRKLITVGDIKTEKFDLVNQDMVNSDSIISDNMVSNENFAKNDIKTERYDMITLEIKNSVDHDMLNAEDAISDMECISNVRDVVAVNIKTEKFDLIKQEFVNIDSAGNDMCVSNLSKDMNNVIKIENCEDINNDERINDKIVYTNKYPVDVSVDVIKAENLEVIDEDISDKLIVKDENDFVVNQDSDIKSSAVVVDCRDSYLGEDNSSDASFLSAQTRRKAKLRSAVLDATESPKKKNRAKVNTSQSSKAGSRFVKLSCSQCPYGTNNELQLMCHMKAHAATESYSCNMCNYITTQRNHLKLHYKTHYPEKTYSCDICNKVYRQQTYLKLHLRKHSGDKQVSCHICNKSFNKKYFEVHLRIHSGEKPHSCDVCKKAFVQKSDLTVHLRTHSGEKPHSCHICNKAYNKKLKLTEHLRTHSGEKPYSCEICNTAFFTKNCLTEHLKTHYVKKPFPCDMCSKSFRKKCYLTKHLLTHSDEKPHTM